MARFLRIIAIILVSLVILLGVAVFIITRVIDPNDFKPQISELAREHANISLDIQGDLAWTFWPSLGVSIGRMEARIEDDEELFAAIDNAELSVRVWPLFSGNVEMGAITLAGLYLDLIEDEQGGNWERIAASDETIEDAPEPAPADRQELDIPVSIPKVSLSDGRVRYRNRADGSDILVEKFNLQASDVQLKQPFPLEMSLRYQDQDDIRIDLSMDTTLTLNPDAEHYRLDPFRATTSIAGITAMPIRINTSQRIDANLGEDRIRVQDLEILAAGTRTRGELEISGLQSELLLRGQLRTDSFDANEVLRGLGEQDIETANPEALSRIALAMTLSGPANSVIVDPLQVQLDGSTLRGRAGVENLDTGKLIFDLDLDRIVLDGYLPPAVEAEEVADSGARAELSDEPLLPLEALRALLIEGRLGVGELSFADFQTQDLELRVAAGEGLLELVSLTGETLEGNFSANGQLDARTDQPRISFNQNAENLQIQPIVEMLLEEDLFIGLINLQANLDATGNSEKALMQSATGRFDFTLTDGTVRGVNLHNVLSNGINEMLSNYSALKSYISGLDDGRRPRALREDTEILDLTARTRLEKMVVYVEQLDADLDRDASIKGEGWLNIHSSDFDMEMRMRAPELSSNPRISGREWPLRCSGNLAGSPARWCLPGSEAFRAAGRELVSRLVREQAAERLGVDEEKVDQVKEEAQQRVEEEKERIRDDVRERARDQLDRLFR